MLEARVQIWSSVEPEKEKMEPHVCVNGPAHSLK